MHRPCALVTYIFLGLSCGSRALPTAPSSCFSPIAVGGDHTRRTPDGNGGISDGGFSVMIGDTELKADDVNTFPAGQHAVTLKASDTDFRGFLLRLASESVGDTTGVLSSDSSDVQILQLCTDMSIGSLAHNNPELKDEISGILDWPLVTPDIELEVTVVVSNQADNPPGSVWYTTMFRLETTAAPPTAAPNVDTPPSKAPTDSPSVMPSAPPSGVASKGVAAALVTLLAFALAELQ